MRRFIFLGLLILTGTPLYAQTPVQIVRGTVLDEDTQLVLPGATIQVLNMEQFTGSATDQFGKFRLENIPIGRIDLLVSYIGYQDRIITNLEVNSAKEVVLDIALRMSEEELGTVEISVSDNKWDALNDMALVGARSVSAEQSLRFAGGGLNDPSKIISSFAGISTMQDGGNEIIIRGNSPKYIQWQLEDVQISNPNHFGDQNAISGIVNALNNTLLSTSDFYTGSFPAEFGDALSGVYDIRMRRGNNENLEGIFSLGLLGTDITMEGPFKKGYDGSFLANFRYSNIGLANNLGLLDEEGTDDLNIIFQDAAMKLWLPTGKWGVFSLFGLHGSSNFNFKDVDPTVWVAPGEDFIQSDVSKDYKKDAGLLHTGGSHIINLSSDSYLKTSFVYSNEMIDDNVFEHLIADATPQLEFRTKLTGSNIRINTLLNYRISAKHKLNVGIRFNNIRQEMDQSRLNEQGERYYLTDFNETLNTIQSFINWKIRVGNRLDIVAGLQNTNVLYNQKTTLEPRLAVNYSLSASSDFSFGYGNHSRMESVHNYFTSIRLPDHTVIHPNLDLGLLRANHFVLGYEKYFGTDLRLKLETYYQGLYNIPVENDKNSSYSTLNEGLELRFVDLVNKGTGENYGIEFGLEKFLSNMYYFMINASLFESKYTALDNIKRNTRYNSNYLLNILGGKEFVGLGKKNNRILTVNAKIFLSGGQYYVPLLRGEDGKLAVIPEQGRVYDESRAYQSKLDDIVNVVLSVSHKWNLNKTTHELYLNIDNVTNNRARLLEYYDSNMPDGVGYVRQVGIIPNLLYRIYF